MAGLETIGSIDQYGCTGNTTPHETHNRDITLSRFDNVMAVRPLTLKTTWVDFARLILSGHTIHDTDKNNAYHFNAIKYNDYRNTDNAIAITALTLDYDEGFSLEDAIEYFRHYEYVIYTSPNHQAYKYHEDGTVKDTPKDKFRIIFPLDTPCPVSDWLMIKNHLDTFAPNVDKASKNITQLFCSNIVHSDNKDKAVVHYNHGEFLDWSTWPKEEPTLRVVNGVLPEHWQPSDYEGEFDEDQLFRLKDGVVRAGDITGKISNVYCPWHDDKSPGTFVNKTGKTVYHFCNKCGTHKMKRATDYSYQDTEAIVQTIQEYKDKQAANESNPIGLLPFNDDITYKDRYVKPIPNIDNAFYFVRSHKNSGKTTRLKEYVADIKRQGKRILVIGHRRTLLEEMAIDLDINYYLNVNWQNDSDLKHMALCVNSMWRLEKVFRPYDVIIMDESEQVIDHLIGETIRPNRRGDVAKQLYKVIKKARQIVCLDADLSINKTVNFIMDIKGDDFAIHGSVNTWTVQGEVINVWDNKRNIEDQIEACINANESIYLTSNSKAFIDQWYAYIQGLGHGERTMRITADNVHTDEAKDYLRKLKNEANGGNRILLATPALGTGINIQADFDTILGVFEAGVNTHYDMDQQLRRVRNATNIHVWVSSKTFTLETDSQVIKQNLLDNDQETRKLIDYNLSDTKEPWFDHLLRVYIQSTTDKNRSMNHLKHNFINLIKEQGYTVNIIEKTKDSKPKLDRKTLSEEERTELKKSLGAANVLSKDDYFDIVRLKRKTKDQQDALMRYQIEHEFGHDIERNLDIVDWWYDRKQNLRNWQLFQAPIEELKAMDRQSMQNHLIDRTNLVQRQGYIKQGLVILGILQYDGDINLQCTLTKGQDNIVDFINWAQVHGRQIKDIVGIEVRGNNATNSPISVVKNFMAKAGLKLVSRGKVMTSERNYTAIYQVDEDYLQWLMDTLTLKEDNQKYFQADR